jgi:hypothetical protein
MLFDWDDVHNEEFFFFWHEVFYDNIICCFFKPFEGNAF